MRRNRTKHAHPAFTSRPWRVQFEQSPMEGAWVYKFPIAESDGQWIELPGKVRRAHRTIGDVVQYVQEIAGLSAKMWRALLRELEHTRPLPIDGVLEGVIFSANGRLFIRSDWITDSDAVRLDALDHDSLCAACPGLFERKGARRTAT